MCGIAGYIGGDSIPATQVQQALDILRPRGPDMEGVVGLTETGQFVQPNASSWNTSIPWRMVFLHTRLSILDLSPAGRQPMPDREGRWIVFNGEIYNHDAIRSELKDRGHHFTTRTDTEIVISAYAEWGTACVQRFNGMWAFAIYDPKKEQVFCSRDRLGVKPFYLARSNENGFGFASEIPALLTLMGTPALIDPFQLMTYLLFSHIDHGAETLYAGIRELRGGHNGILDLTNNKWQEERYWKLPAEEDFAGTDIEALDRFSELLEDAVKLRLRADVPVALLLSGGIDSSAVALAASRVGGKPLAFTSHFPDFPSIDETAYAKIVADRMSIDHELVIPDIGNVLIEESALTRAQAAPYGSLSLYVHWKIIRKVREQNVPVVLSGQGGDELFFGYERYYVAYLLSVWPDYGALLRSWIDISRHSRLGLGETLAYLVYFGIDSLKWRRWRHNASQALSPGLFKYAPSFPKQMPADRRALQHSELAIYNLPRLLRYDDRTAARQAVETRLPFLDYRLVEFAHQLPWRFTMRQGWTKHLIRRYLDRHGLAAVAWRTNKLGFNAPTDKWLQILLTARWEELRNTEFAQKVVRPGVDPVNMAARSRWDVYNVCHLASLHNWRFAE